MRYDKEGRIGETKMEVKNKFMELKEEFYCKSEMLNPNLRRMFCQSVTYLSVNYQCIFLSRLDEIPREVG